MRADDPAMGGEPRAVAEEADRSGATVERLEVHAFTVPTDGPDGQESDGTLTWDSTTMVLVVAHGGGRIGIGYTYADVSAARFVESKLAPVVCGGGALAPPVLWHRMFAAIRIAGRPGPGAMAVSAVDVALWDLKARLMEAPLTDVLPSFHDAVPVYGSGGFTNYPLERLTAQLAGWVEEGIPRVKLKTSRDPDSDPARLSAVREAIGAAPELFTDANGALSRKQALYCGGITGLLQVAGLAAGHQVDLSGHCAPALSGHALCCVERLRHLEYFHDHVRVENLLFDGVLAPHDGVLRPDRSSPGLGLTVKWADAEPYRVHGGATG